MKLNEIVSTSSDFSQWYVVEFTIKGSRANGTYLVKALNARAAKQAVKLKNDRFVPQQVVGWVAHCDEFDEDPVAEIKKHVPNYTNAPIGLVLNWKLEHSIC